MDEFHNHYIEYASKENAQQNYQKVVEWYGGDKEHVLRVFNTPPDSQIMQSYQNRTEAIMMKLSEKRDKAVSSFEVKSLIGEYSFIIKQLYQIEDEKPLMLEMAASYRNDSTLRTGLDDKYSAGTADFFFKAVEEFYKL